MANKSYTRIEAVIKAGAILKYLASQKSPVTGADTARAVGMATPTVMCHLITLVDLGFVRQVGDGFELGMGLALFWARKKAMLESERERIDRDIEKLGN